MFSKIYSHKINLTAIAAASGIWFFILILTSSIIVGYTEGNVQVKDYLNGKFDSWLFHLYLDSMGDLDDQEIEFIDLLSTQNRDVQVFYGKEIYQEGFRHDLLLQLKREIDEREGQSLKREEKEFVQDIELPIPQLPSMKWWEKMYGYMVSMRKVTSTTDYNRFSICGVDPARSERVIKRVRNYFDWTEEWREEGQELERLAEEAKVKGNIFLARRLFHEAAGCYHIGGYINYYDIEEKFEVQNLARKCYEKAIELYNEEDKPIRIEIPFRGVEIPGYLLLTDAPNQPLIIFVNVLNNIKEVENHFYAQDFLKAGFNVFSFDGPGQGEMHQKMRLIPDYERAIRTIIDWFEVNNRFDIDLSRIGVMGISFGGFFSVQAAALDARIDCVMSNGGFAYFPPLSHLKKLSIPTKRSVYYMTGYQTMSKVREEFGHLDIRECPPLDRPMLIIQGGKDKTVPLEHAQCFIDWAVGEKELLYYKDSNHCCQDVFDLITPYTIDWLRKYLK